MKISGATDIGQRRMLNEDSFFIKENENCFCALVSDGMGGHNAGDIASKIISDTFENFISDVNIYENTDVNLKRLVSLCNYNVYSHSKNEFAGMGATFVAGVYNGEKLFVANLGDSRAYLISNGEIRQVSEDHSYVFELVKNRIITTEEAKIHPQRNEITKAVGIVPEVFPDLFMVDFEKGDMLLLCSDGLSNMIDDNEIKDIIENSEDIAKAVGELILKANQNGGIDNITVVLAEI